MKKRLLSIVLCICMVMSLLPTAAFAAEGETDSGAPIGASDVQNSGTTQEQAPTEGEQAPTEGEQASAAAPTCTCGSKCTEGEVNADCEVCKSDFTKCAFTAEVPAEKTAYEKCVDLFTALPKADSITAETTDEGKEAVFTQLGEAMAAYDALSADEQEQFETEHADLLVAALALNDAIIGDTPATYAYSGNCGTSATWTFDSNTGALVISGSGAMTSAPWKSSYAASIKSVTIEDGITSIYYAAFDACSALETVTIGEGVTTIGDNAFKNCTKLETIHWNAISVGDFTDNNTVFFYAGTGGNGISVTFGDNVTTIPRRAFGGSYNSSTKPTITSVNLGNSVQTIGDFAFKQTAITSIDIPNSTTSIGSSAFYECSDLETVTIGEGVTSIGNNAFNRCTQLKKINWNAISVADFANDNTIFYQAGKDGAGISVTFGNKVTKIPNYAFWSSGYSDTVRPKITSVNLGSSVQTIGDSAFRYTPITSIVIPDSTTSIGAYAFAYCTSLATVTIGNSVQTISSYAFQYCSSLTTLTIGEGVTSIGYQAFYNTPKLATINWNAISVADFANDNTIFYQAGKDGAGISVTFGNKVTKIPNYAFWSSSYPSANLPKITSVNLGSSVKTIGSDSFIYAAITSIDIPNSTTSIGAGAFQHCTKVTSLTIGKGVESIGSAAFYDTPKLATINWNAISVTDFAINNTIFYNAGIIGTGIVVTFGDNVTTIPSRAFWSSSYPSANLPKITSVNLGSSVKTIGSEAFIYAAITSIDIPNSTTSIGAGAFQHCTKVTSLTIGEGVESIGSTAFYDTPKLETIHWNAISVDDFATDNTIFFYAGTSGTGISVIFGDKVERIPSRAFYGSNYSNDTRPKITSVNLGSSVQTIGSYAFAKTAIKSINIPNSVTTIHDYAFSNCSQLSFAVIGTGVTTIGAYAFGGYGTSTYIFVKGKASQPAGWNANWYSTNPTIRWGCSLSIINADKSYDGQPVVPTVAKSGFEGTDTFEYKVAGTEDSTYITSAPYAMGNYTVRYSVVKDGLTLDTTTKDFTISESEYTVRFNANPPADATGTVTGAMADSAHKLNQQKSLPTNQFALTGWSFKGWATTVGGTVAYTDGMAVTNLTNTAGGTVNLYAVWEQNTYNLILDANGGAGGGTAIATYDGALPTITAPTRTGYTFAGYYTQKADGTCYYKANLTSNVSKWNKTEATTLYARWTPLTYKINLNSNISDGSGPQFVTTQSGVVYGTLTLPGVESIPTAQQRANYTFVGWNIYDQQNWAMYLPGQTYQTGLCEEQDGTVNLYAAWTENEKFTVAYNANGGRGEPANQQAYIGTNAVLSAEKPTQEGYTFLGWSKSASAAAADYAAGGTVENVQANVTLYAVWQQNPSLTYHANGGSFSVYVPAAYPTMGADFTLTSVIPTKDGYDFAGWTTDEENTGTVYAAGGAFLVPSSADPITLYAKWTAKKYTVTVSTPSGVTVTGINTNEKAYSSGETVTFTVTGGTNVRVYAAGLMLTEVEGKYSFEIKADTTVQVVSGANTYVVTYDANGGENAPVDAAAYTSGASVTVKTSKPTRTGYTFGGWKNGETAVSDTFSITADTTLIAQWTAITYTVNYNGNGSDDGNTASSTHTYDTPAALTTNDFTKTGNTFVGWATSISGDVVYLDGAGVKNLSATAGQAITLYAKWEPSVTKLVFNGNGGNLGMSIAYVYATYGETLTENLNPPTWDGYLFGGFYTGADGSGMQVYKADMTSAIGTTWSRSDSEITIYAKWTPITYNVEFYNDSTKLSYTDLYNISYTKQITLPSLTALGLTAPAGKYLAGWSIWPGSTYALYANGQAFTTGLTTENGATVKLYTVWKDIEKFTVNYYANGGSGAPVDALEYAEGATVTVNFDTIPTRPGYTFLGWSANGAATSATYTKTGTNTLTMGTSYVNLFAVWQALNTYPVTYHKNTTDTVVGLPDSGSKMENTDYTLSSTVPGRTGYTFTGWNTASGGGGTAYAPGANYTGNAALTLYAQWKQDTYAVTYNGNAFTSLSYTDAANHVTVTVSGDSIVYGGSYTITVTPDTGYDGSKMLVQVNGNGIVGKQSGNNWVYTVNGVMAEQSISVSGAEKKQYTVTFMMNDGTDSTYITRTVAHGETVAKPANPTRSGYTFTEWNSGAAAYDFNTTVTSNLTLTAQWTQQTTYGVSYDPNGGTGAPESQVKIDGTALTLSTVEPIRIGYTFTGWNTEKDGVGGTAYAAGASYTGNAAVTLYAQWTQNTYAVTYNGNAFTGLSYTDAANHVTVTVSGDSIVYGGSYTITITPETGYDGSKMLVQVNGTGIVGKQSGTSWTYTINNVIAAQDIVVSQTDATVYTVTFLMNDGTDSVYVTRSVAHGTVVTKPADPTRSGYTFTGWNSGSTAYNFDGTVTSDLTLDAQWTQELTYGVSYDPNGGTGAPESQVKIDGTALTLSTVEPIRIGYTFTGWSTEKDGVGGTAYAAGASYTGNAALTLYAQWTQNSYAVKYGTHDFTGNSYTDAANHVTVKVSGVSIVYGGSYTITVTPETGYDGSKMVVKVNGTVVGGEQTGTSWKYTINNVTAAQTLSVSNKDATSYTVTFRMNDGTDSVYVTRSVAHGTVVTKPADPTRSGYTFTGWNSGSTAYNFDGTVTSDLTLDAQWTQKLTYGVSYDPNGGTGAPESQVKIDGTALTLSTVEPIRIGYTFTGWNTSANGSGVDYAAGANYTGNAALTLYAQWTQNSYTVKYGTHDFTDSSYTDNENNVTVTVSGDSIVYGGSYTITVTPETGYDGSKMLVQVNGNGIVGKQSGNNWVYTVNGVMAEQSISVSGAEKKQYTVTFRMNDGTDSVYVTGTVAHGTAAAQPKAPTRAGYEFAGWNSGSAKYVFSSPVTANLILDAQWNRLATYKVTYNANGGANAPYTQEKSDGVDLTLSAVKPIRTGFTFIGWSAKPDATQAEYVSGGAYSKDADITLYAVWTTRTFTVTPAESGMGYTVSTAATNTVNYGGSYFFTVTLDGGYVGGGMIVSANGTTLAPTISGNVYSYTVSNILEDVTISVTGIKQQVFAVNLPVGTGYTTSGANSVAYGDDYSFTITLSDGYTQNPPTVKNGADKLTGTQSGNTYTYKISTVKAAPSISVADVTQNPGFKVIYVTDAAGQYAVQNVESGAKAVAPYPPAKVGYTFIGWKAEDAANNWDFGTDTVTADTTLYAVWTLNPATVNVGSNYSGTYDADMHRISVSANHNYYGVNFSYQWYKNSVDPGNKVGENSDSLSLQNVSDSASYICVVTATDGTLTSTANSAPITVAIAQAIPTITLSSKSASVTGAPITIGAAVVTGITSGNLPTGKITYLYYSDAACTQALSGAPSDAGTYYVKATIAADGNYAQAESTAVTLTLTAAGGGGIGGGGGAGGTGTTQTVPVSSNGGKTSVDATVSDGTAKITMTDEQLKQIAASTENVGTVEIDTSALENVERINIPAKVIKTVAETSGANGMKLMLPTGSVELSDTALSSLNTGKDVVISMKSIKTSDLTAAQKAALEGQLGSATVVDVQVLVNGVSVTAFDGGELTVSIPCDQASGAKLSVWYLKNDGTTENMGGYYDAASKSFVFETRHLSKYALVSQEENPFTDVAKNAYYYDAVLWAVEQGVTSGVSSDRFNPNGICTRAQAVTFLWRASGRPEPKSTECPFTDVSTSAYYYKAVLWAVEQGITMGTSNTTFSPDATCSRGQIVTFLYRAAGSPQNEASSAFTDVHDGAYYADAAVWAAKEKITVGTSNTTFSPSVSCTRAQIVTFLYRQMGK